MQIPKISILIQIFPTMSHRLSTIHSFNHSRTAIQNPNPNCIPNLLIILGDHQLLINHQI